MDSLLPSLSQLIGTLPLLACFQRCRGDSIACAFTSVLFIVFLDFRGADFPGRQHLSGSQRGGVGQRTKHVGAPRSHEGGAADFLSSSRSTLLLPVVG